jgi:uncharacterized protein YjeT (DUF2065 family)
MATTFLATVIGWYLVIISVILIIRHEHVKSVMEDVLAQKGLFAVVAIMTLILGLILVASHNIWVNGWPVIVTLFCWLVLISGLLRVCCPSTARKIANSLIVHPRKMIVLGVIFLLIGLFLLSHVYFAVYY